MRFSSFLAATALALTLLAPSTGRAGPITYSIDDYPGLQRGLHVSGSITTDGSIGPLQAAAITSWNYTITDAGGTVISSLTSAKGTADVFYDGPPVFIVTEKSIDYHVPFGVRTDIFDFAETGGDAVLDWRSQGAEGQPAYEATAGIMMLWSSVLAPGTVHEIASVPEPATLSLVLVGIGGLVGVRLAKRRSARASGPIESPPAHS
jgi:hypothetical protein